MQEDRKWGFVIFILTWLFYPCWNSWTGAPNLYEENEAVCKCWYCKYTGSVFFRAFFMYLKACNV